MAANCTILSFISRWFNKKRLDLSSDQLPTNPLINHFNEVTGCKSTDDCFDNTFCNSSSSNYICNLAIAGINGSISPDGSLTVVPTGITGGVPSYTAQWVYPTSFFDYIAGQGTIMFQIKLKDYTDHITLGATLISIAIKLTDTKLCIGNASKVIPIPLPNINCSGKSISGGGSFYQDIPVIETITIPYTSGNGVPFGAYVVHSTGVIGLTATLPGDILTGGAGNFIFNVTGTPTSSGIATFTFEMFGVECVFNIPVVAEYCATPPIGYTLEGYNSVDDTWNVKLVWGLVTNSIGYTLVYIIDGVSTTVDIPTTDPNYLNLEILSDTDFSATIYSTCSLSTSDSSSFSDVTPPPATPLTCPTATAFTNTAQVFDVGTNDYVETFTWSAATGAISYILHTTYGPQTIVVTGLTADIHVPSGTTTTVSFYTTCASGDSEVIMHNVTTPSAPLPPGIDPTIYHTFTNVGSSTKNLQVWATLDASVTRVKILQGDIFGSYTSDSGWLTVGLSNGYTPTPMGFGANDIYFNATTAPIGYPIIGAAMTKVKFIMDTGSFIYTTEYWMNVPQAYSTRLDTPDYIQVGYNVDPSIVISGSPTTTLASLYMDPGLLGIHYDSCSYFNVFLRASIGGITTLSYPNPTTAFSFAGLASGQYKVFLEMSHDSCTTAPTPYSTATPITLTIP